MNSFRSCFSFSSWFSRPTENKSPSSFFVFAVSGEKNLWRSCNFCCFVGPRATLFTFVFFDVFCSCFSIVTFLSFFAFGFLGCGWELKVVVRYEVVRRNTKKSLRFDFCLGRTRYCKLWKLQRFICFVLIWTIEGGLLLSNIRTCYVQINGTFCICTVFGGTKERCIFCSWMYVFFQLHLPMLFLFCCYFFWLFGERTIIVLNLDHHLYDTKTVLIQSQLL